MSKRNSSKIDWGQIAQAAAGALGGLFVTKTVSNYLNAKVIPADMQKYVPAILGVGVAMGAPLLPIDQRNLKLGLAAGGGLAVIGAVAAAAGMQNPVNAYTGLDFAFAGPMEREIEIRSINELENLTRSMKQLEAPSLNGDRDATFRTQAPAYGQY